MIELKKVSKRYGDHQIFEDLDLTIGDGEFVTVVGTSGSGKTTLMKMINGLVQADSGRVVINGQDITDQNLIALRRQIGYVIQGNVLFPHLTVAENVSYVLDLEKRSQSDKDRIVKEKLAMVGLENTLASRYPAELSGGQAQRVGIARGLAATPKILLMDEPFGAVDAITRYQMQSEVKKLHQTTGVTIIFITHDIAEALRLGTKVLVLSDGKIQQYDTPAVIKRNPATEFVRNLLEIAGENCN